MGIEALSRGEARAVFIEKNRAAVEVIRENLRSLEIENRSEVYTGKTLWVLERLSGDIVFLDPPYELDRDYDQALAVLAAKETSLAIAQHDSRLRLDEEYGRLRRSRIVRQGDNALSFYEMQDTGAP